MNNVSHFPGSEIQQKRLQGWTPFRISYLDEIIRNFNERWFQGWSATPEEQGIKFINIADSIKAHPDFEEKYKNNQDTHNRELAFEKIFEEVMLKNRRNELDLYKLWSTDAAFKAAMQQSLQQLIS